VTPQMGQGSTPLPRHSLEGSSKSRLNCSTAPLRERLTQEDLSALTWEVWRSRRTMV